MPAAVRSRVSTRSSPPSPCIRRRGPPRRWWRPGCRCGRTSPRRPGARRRARPAAWCRAPSRCRRDRRARARGARGRGGHPGRGPGPHGGPAAPGATPRAGCGGSGRRAGRRPCRRGRRPGQGRPRSRGRGWRRPSGRQRTHRGRVRVRRVGTRTSVPQRGRRGEGPRRTDNNRTTPSRPRDGRGAPGMIPTPLVAVCRGPRASAEAGEVGAALGALRLGNAGALLVDRDGALGLAVVLALHAVELCRCRCRSTRVSSWLSAPHRPAGTDPAKHRGNAHRDRAADKARPPGVSDACLPLRASDPSRGSCAQPTGRRRAGSNMRPTL